MRDSTPDQASPNIFSTNSLMSKANQNCKSDKIVWAKANCSGTTQITSPGDPNGVCVPIKAITDFASMIGGRYSGVFSSYNFLVCFCRNSDTKSGQLWKGHQFFLRGSNWRYYWAIYKCYPSR